MSDAISEKNRFGEGFAFFRWLCLNGRGQKCDPWQQRWHHVYWEWGYR